MRVAAFSVKPYDRASLAAASAGLPIEWDWFEPRLDRHTARLAEGAAAVNCFVNDQLDAATLDILAALGVKVRFIEVSRAQFWPKWQSGKFMMCQDGWNWYPTAAGALYNSFYGPLDESGSFYDDAAVNASLRQANETLDDAARLAAFQSINATIAPDVPVTPIAYFSRTAVCSARLHEAVLSPMNLFDFTRVWMQ